MPNNRRRYYPGEYDRADLPSLAPLPLEILFCEDCGECEECDYTAPHDANDCDLCRAGTAGH